MSNPIRIIQFGLGPIGLDCARQLLLRRSEALQLVGAVDIDPAKIGRDVALLCGINRDSGVLVSATLDDALHSAEADAVLHTTSSFLEVVADQLTSCLRSGLHVVSSTEELSFPFARHPEISRRLDQVAKSNGVSVVGTGVNPGFVMDTLALLATAVCTRVDAVRIERVVDAGRRRLPLQHKIGAGLSVDEFEERKAAGGFGHVGLQESARMIAEGLGWPVGTLTETLQPEMVPMPNPDANGDGRPRVAGIRQQVVLKAADGRVVELTLRMFVGADAPADTIEIAGEPPVKLTIPGGVFGDTATVAMLINTAPRIVEAPAGLQTMLTLALPRALAPALDRGVLIRARS